VSALAVQGTSSSAGKSLLATALCRHFARRGLRVAPFKAQNMSNNARVVGGGEIGVAQYLQALAAGVEPEVRMNPVLVKPEGERRSQVVVLGTVDRELSRTPWRRRAPALWPVVESSLRALLREFELVVIEGAGSPAEINLRDCDLANMRAAGLAEAPVLLVADIDRGGAFAHLYGTWALLAQPDRALIRGFVLNKFRGEEALLEPAPARLRELTGVPVLGIVPWLEHGLPDEDSASDYPSGRDRGPLVAIVRYPTASNLDEFRPLEQVARIVWAREPGDLADADLVVLPGSKHVASDLGWLRRTGVAAAAVEHARRGGRLLGVCGGLQMLGGQLDDPAGVDGSSAGLGLLPLRTVFADAKLTRRTSARFAALDPPWQALSGLPLRGYEIRHGRTVPCSPVREALSGALGFVSGPVLALTVHGLFEEPALVAALVGAAPHRSLEQALDELTDAVIPRLDAAALDALAGLAPTAAR
jgi:adenosylcobyric acid synthase